MTRVGIIKGELGAKMIASLLVDVEENWFDVWSLEFGVWSVGVFCHRLLRLSKIPLLLQCRGQSIMCDNWNLPCWITTKIAQHFGLRQSERAYK